MFSWKQSFNPSLLISLWSYRTASSKKQLSKQAQRAAWATKIIKTIKRSQREECIYSPSLSEKLVNLQDPHPSYHFDPEIKEEILNTFTSGISVDYLSFRQERFKRARQEQFSKLTIIFCPNYLVTQQMFILTDLYSLLLVIGNYGISKSICLMLYSTLAKHINLYYYQASISSRHSDKESAIDLKKEIETLEKEKIVEKQLKYWYWTINRKDIRRKGWKSIQQSFIHQADELSKEEKEELWKCQSLKQFILRLCDYYPQYKIWSRIIIDQINELASLMSQWNEFVKLKIDELGKMNKLTQKERLSLLEETKEHQRLYFHPANELISIFYNLQRLCGWGYILNSSISIDKKLFSEIRRRPYKNKFVQQVQNELGLHPLALPIFGHHDRVKQVQMSYSQNLREDWGRNDFFHFFWFQFRRMLSMVGLSEEKGATAKRIFLSVAQKRIGRGYYRIIFIKDYLQTVDLEASKFKQVIETLPSISDLKEAQYQRKMLAHFPPETLSKMFPQSFMAEKEGQAIQAQASPQEAYQQHPLATTFNEMLDNFDHLCRDWEKERVKIFMKKGDYQQKMKFMMTIYSLAEQALIENKQLKFPVDYLQAVLGVDTTAHFLSEEHNQQLLPINRNVYTNEIVDLLWTPAEFIQLTSELICPSLYKIHKPLFASLILQSNKMHPLSRGIMFQLLFLYQLNPKTAIKFKMFVSQYSTYKLSTSISASLTFLSFNYQIVRQFYNQSQQNLPSDQPLPGSKQLFYLETNLPAQMPSLPIKDNEIIPFDVDLHFEDILNYCNSNVDHFASGVPYYKNVFVHNNKCIDFVLAIKDRRKTTIYTFDLTVGTNVQSKISNALKFLKNLVAPSPNMFDFVHIIVTPEARQERIIISNNLSIQFSDIDSFEMENVTHPNEYSLLKILQEANQKMRRPKASLRK